MLHGEGGAWAASTAETYGASTTGSLPSAMSAIATLAVEEEEMAFLFEKERDIKSC